MRMTKPVCDQALDLLSPLEIVLFCSSPLLSKKPELVRIFPNP